MLHKISLLLLLYSFSIFAQKGPIKIVEEKIPNRLALYAVNESETDYDVLLEVTGTNFKQSAGNPRLTRVPGASKVLVKTLIVTRGEEASYTYNLKINDSLSRRALRKDFIPIKIKPKKNITVYITENCLSCDTIINGLSNSHYLYTTLLLSENPDVVRQLEISLSYLNTPLHSIPNPIISLAGVLYVEIETYAGLIVEMNK